MTRSQERLQQLLMSLPVLVIGLAVLYQLGMENLEAEVRTLAESIEWASETLTSTGYGRDDDWQHPAMIADLIASVPACCS